MTIMLSGAEKVVKFITHFQFYSVQIIIFRDHDINSLQLVIVSSFFIKFIQWTLFVLWFIYHRPCNLCLYVSIV